MRLKEEDLGVALDEFYKMIGLSSVKKQIQKMAQLALTNYERELRGEAPCPVSLNRVFLGNPGTGKKQPLPNCVAAFSRRQGVSLTTCPS